MRYMMEASLVNFLTLLAELIRGYSRYVIIFGMIRIIKTAMFFAGKQSPFRGIFSLHFSLFLFGHEFKRQILRSKTHRLKYYNWITAFIHFKKKNVPKIITTIYLRNEKKERNKTH